MTDRESTFAAMVARPACDTTRLVHADAVQEAGDETLAQWIRESGEERFQSQLDMTPRDHNVRFLLSAWFRYCRDPRGLGYMALARMEKYPITQGLDAMYLRERLSFASNLPSSFHIPEDWFDLVDLPEHHGLKPTWSRTSPKRKSRRFVDDAVALAFSELPVRRQAELLR